MTDIHKPGLCECGRYHESVSYIIGKDIHTETEDEDVSKYITPITMSFADSQKRGYTYIPSLDVDRPLFDLFGIDFDNDRLTQCPICHKLVGYDAFTFTNKEFYHIACYINKVNDLG
jgi:hypothetical protein